ncbi:hypothetical protein [Gandjariella thermophila]|uniref:Uncharacterized protein n=1 Tax=Gandjariella thermophila TaxID=1931992 RepID=A0A4D4J9U4_9PSEU|nr:hypothetical protein [Gandjariella thermophila]GDY32062.1 hypothetical protein GTS_36950 [Gandjariella thermophila]
MSSAADQDELATFCAELHDLRRLLAGPASAADRAAVEQAVRAARRGEPIGPFLARLRSEPGPGDDRLPPPCPTRGGPLPPEVLDSGSPPVTGVYVCPGDACSRVEVRRAGAAVPRCAVHERALRFVAD